jgi:hypothetical protein
MDAVNNLPLLAIIAVMQQFLAAAALIMDDVPTKFESMFEKKKKGVYSLQMKRGGKGMNPHDYSGACLSVRCAHG